MIWEDESREDNHGDYRADRHLLTRKMFHEDNFWDYHADRHLLRGRCSICMIYDENVVIIYDKKEFSIERMFRPSLVLPSTL